MSPCGQSPLHSSANSDGYSEFEETEAPVISSALNSLILNAHSADLPSPVNPRLKFSEKVRPCTYIHCHGLYFFELCRSMTLTLWSVPRHNAPPATTKVTGSSGTQGCLLRKEGGL